jgi:hypothetical protein
MACQRIVRRVAKKCYSPSVQTGSIGGCSPRGGRVTQAEHTPSGNMEPRGRASAGKNSITSGRPPEGPRCGHCPVRRWGKLPRYRATPSMCECMRTKPLHPHTKSPQMRAEVPPGIVLSGFKTKSCGGMFVRSGENVNGVPSYRQEGDGGMWLCFVPEKRFWMVQTAEKRGTSKGGAHTVGDYAAPWEAETRWKESVKGKATDARVGVIALTSAEEVQPVPPTSWSRRSASSLSCPGVRCH